MAGNGPPPKDPSRRARGHRGEVLRVITAEPVDQPDLPTFEVEKDGELTEFVWPARTLQWWRMWAESPLSAEFTSVDWDYLLDTAVLHAKFWRGSTKEAAELRLRVAAFGATPADRAKLRITFAQADEAESKPTTRVTSRSRRGALKALPSAASE